MLSEARGSCAKGLTLTHPPTPPPPAPVRMSLPSGLLSRRYNCRQKLPAVFIRYRDLHFQLLLWTFWILMYDLAFWHMGIYIAEMWHRAHGFVRVEKLGPQFLMNYTPPTVARYHTYETYISVCDQILNTTSIQTKSHPFSTLSVVLGAVFIYFFGCAKRFKFQRQQWRRALMTLF